MTLNIRFINGTLAALIMIFFFVHAVLGTMSIIAGFRAEQFVSIIIFAAFALIVVHVFICITTSTLMLRDTLRPPSKKKKAHLALKWISGSILLILAILHILKQNNLLPIEFFEPHLTQRLIVIAVVAALGWHCFVGIKSLLKDINASKKIRIPLRIIVCTITAGIITVSVLF